MKLLTGDSGYEHINSENDSYVNQGIVGKDSYVLNVGYKFATELLSDNIVRIKNGVLAHSGRYGVVENYEDVKISNGTQGVNRTDLIVARYVLDASSGIEAMPFVVIKGSSGIPAIAQSGDVILYKVNLQGVNIVSVVSQFSIAYGLKSLEEMILAKEITLKSYTDSKIATLNGSLSSSISSNVANLNARITAERNTLNDRITIEASKSTAGINNAMDYTNYVRTNLTSIINTLAARVTQLEH